MFFKKRVKPVEKSEVDKRLELGAYVYSSSRHYKANVIIVGREEYRQISTSPGFKISDDGEIHYQDFKVILLGNQENYLAMGYLEELGD